MDVQELISKYSPLIKKHWLLLSLGILGLIFFAYGLIGLFFASKTDTDGITFEASAGQSSQEVKTIIVDVEGAVVKPGVYKLPQESRIQDGLIAAGGLSAQADRQYIAKNLNLATKLNDGTKIYIPAIDEDTAKVPASDNSSQGVIAGNTININTASESELDTLPGIGPVTARKITTGRPYNSISDLLDRKIVSSKVFDQIKDKIATY